MARICEKCNGTGKIKIITFIVCSACRGMGSIEDNKKQSENTELIELRKFKQKILEVIRTL